MEFPMLENNLTLESLPPEILQTILRNLEGKDLLSVSRVSRRLRCAVFEDPSLWRSVNLDPNSVSEAKLISELCSLIKCLRLKSSDGDEKIHEKTLKLFAGYKDLERLIFGSNLVTRRMIRLVSRSFPNLKELAISDTEDVNRLRPLSKLKSLESLHVSCPFHRLADAECLDIVADNFPRLRSFYWFVAARDEEMIRVIERHNETLTRLSVASFNLTDSTYVRLADCRNLVKLELFGAKRMTDLGLTGVRSLPNLKSLLFGALRQSVSSGALINFFQNAINLTSVQFFDCGKNSHLNDDVALAVIAKCRNLRHLGFQVCGNLTEVTIRAIVDNCAGLFSLRLDQKTIPDDCLPKIVERLTGLRKLFLSNDPRKGWRFLSDPVVVRLKELAPDLTIKECYFDLYPDVE